MIRKNNCKLGNSAQKGMTLVELLIAVAIIGVITAIAYPSYTKHVLKSHRVTALGDLSKMQLLLETTYDGSYDFSEVMSSSQCVICDTDSDRYVFSVTSDASNAYILKATAQNTKGQTGDECLANETNKVMQLTATNTATPLACWD